MLKENKRIIKMLNVEFYRAYRNKDFDKSTACLDQVRDICRREACTFHAQPCLDWVIYDKHGELVLCFDTTSGTGEISYSTM